MNYPEIVKRIEDLVDELIKESDGDFDEARDRLHEEIDGLDLVIYYGKAWQVVNELPSSVLDDAESTMIDTGFEFESLNKTMTILAFWALYNIASEYLNQKESESL